MIAVSAFIIYGVVYPLDEAKARMQTNSLASHSDSNDWSSGIPWQLWSASEVAETVRSGKMVFVDFTASYCTVCKVNKAAATYTQEARDKMQEFGVVAYQGDFSTGDSEIFAELQKHSRAGVPLNLIFPAGKPDSPIVLRPSLTKQYLLDKLDEANRLGNTQAKSE